MAKPFHELRSRMSVAAQEAATRKTARMLATMPLQRLRQARQLSQEDMAAILHVKQSSISKLERRENIYVATLQAYVEAMGGTLEIVARFHDEEVKLQ